jgi:prepilin peptidase CpaA
MSQNVFFLFTPGMTAGGMALLLAAGAEDIALRMVSNRLSLALALCGAALRWREGTLGVALIAALAVFVAAAFCWRRGWLGGGDVKLLGAASLFVPPGQIPALLLATALAGGVLALLYLALAALPAPTPPRGPKAKLIPRILRAERWRIRRHGPLPYASAIAAGAVFTLFR